MHSNHSFEQRSSGMYLLNLQSRIIKYKKSNVICALLNFDPPRLPVAGILLTSGEDVDLWESCSGLICQTYVGKEEMVCYSYRESQWMPKSCQLEYYSICCIGGHIRYLVGLHNIFNII